MAKAFHITKAIWRRAALGLYALPLLLGAAAAQEYIEVDGPLSDEDFYRVVACAAAPQGDCNKPIIRWPSERQLRLQVGIAQIGEGFADYKLDLIDRALDDAITQINSAGANLFLERAYEGAFDIPIFLTDTAQGGTLQGTGRPELDGTPISVGRVVLRSRAGEITSAAIAISRDVRRREIASVVLEELVQAMGLPTDIASPAYSRSVFSETSNSVVWLRGQDAQALRMHYPRN